MLEQLKQKINRWWVSTAYAGNVPPEQFLNKITNLSIKELVILEVEHEAKQQNIALFQKIYWWVFTGVTLFVGGSIIATLKHFAANNHLDTAEQLLPNSLLIFLIYCAIMVTPVILSQIAKNDVMKRLAMIKRVLSQKSKE